MEHKPVKSSMIASIGHEGDVLEIEFKNGKRYQYKGVPVELFDRMLTVQSVGKFFGQKIKGKFSF